MRKRQTQQVGDVIAEFLRNSNLENTLLEHHVIEAWPKVIGATLARYTSTPTIENGVLKVKISSAPLRQEFFIGRHEIVRRLNEAVGAQVVKDIRLG